MSSYYTLHCEAFVDGKWENWDLYTFKSTNQYKIIPLVEGKSCVRGALNWYNLLSNPIDRSQVAEKTLDAHPTEYPEFQKWYAFEYDAFFFEKDFSVPEYCGYFAKDILNQFKAERDYDVLEAAVQGASFLLPADFAKLTHQAQRGFEWYEFTSPFSFYDVMRRIQQGTQIRIYGQEACPIRIVILEE